MESSRDAGELDLAQGAGRGSEGPGGVDHRSHDLARAVAEGARRVRGRVEEDALFLPGAARCQAGCRSQPRRDGEIPGGDATLLFEQVAAVQLERAHDLFRKPASTFRDYALGAASGRHRTSVGEGVAAGPPNPHMMAAWPWEDGMARPSVRAVTLALPFMLVLAAGAAGQGAEQKTATFAGGCFWCVEADFDKVEGVVGTTSGYTGGGKPNPSYEEVSRGGTGHAEAVEIVYDPSKVSYQKLLDVFWHNIDPLVKDRQ